MSPFRLLLAALVLATVPQTAEAGGRGRNYSYFGGFSRPFGGTYTYYYASLPGGPTIGGGTFSGYGVPVQPVYVAPVYPMYYPSYSFHYGW